jgi:hypothetical protein
MAMRVAWVFALLIACGGQRDDRSDDFKMKEIDATRFHAMLADKDEGSRIENIRAQPLGHDSARYVITFKNTNTKDVVYAEFPGKIIDEIIAASIPYSVKPAN